MDTGEETDTFACDELTAHSCAVFDGRSVAGKAGGQVHLVDWSGETPIATAIGDPAPDHEIPVAMPTSLYLFDIDERIGDFASSDHGKGIAETSHTRSKRLLNTIASISLLKHSKHSRTQQFLSPKACESAGCIPMKSIGRKSSKSAVP